MNMQTELSGSQLPNRVRHSYTQSVSATPNDVFPLLCPIREHDWAPGWSTDWVISRSGLVEQECLFQTPAKAGAKDASIWIVTRHDPSAYEVEMYKVTPGQTVGKLAISLTAQGAMETRAQISYEFTSLGPDGDAFLDEFTEESYEKFMRGWETAINHYLVTGEQLNVAA